jgi:transcriptional regulator GlxA family with amidase domain
MGEYTQTSPGPGDEYLVSGDPAHGSSACHRFAKSSRRLRGRSNHSTCSAYVEALRVERARAPLEDGAESLEAVARAGGFPSAEVLRRAFHRRVGVSPAAYRERFRIAI